MRLFPQTISIFHSTPPTIWNKVSYKTPPFHEMMNCCWVSKKQQANSEMGMDINIPLFKKRHLLLLPTRYQIKRRSKRPILAVML